MLNITITNCKKDFVDNTYKVSGKITKEHSNIIMTHLYILFTSEINCLSINTEDEMIFVDMSFYELCAMSSYGFFVHFKEDFNLQIDDSVDYASDLKYIAQKYYGIGEQS